MKIYGEVASSLDLPHFYFVNEKIEKGKIRKGKSEID